MECTIALRNGALSHDPDMCKCPRENVVTCQSEGDTALRYTCASGSASGGDVQQIPSQLRTARASVLQNKKP